MENSEFLTLKQAIVEMLNNNPTCRDKVFEARLSYLWQKVMGKPIAKHTTNISFKNKKLYISIDSAPLKNELSYAKEKIISLLNAELEKEIIKEIVFR